LFALFLLWVPRFSSLFFFPSNSHKKFCRYRPGLPCCPAFSFLPGQTDTHYNTISSPFCLYISPPGESLPAFLIIRPSFPVTVSSLLITAGNLATSPLVEPSHFSVTRTSLLFPSVVCFSSEPPRSFTVAKINTVSFPLDIPPGPHFLISLANTAAKYDFTDPVKGGPAFSPTIAFCELSNVSELTPLAPDLAQFPSWPGSNRIFGFSPKTPSVILCSHFLWLFEGPFGSAVPFSFLRTKMADNLFLHHPSVLTVFFAFIPDTRSSANDALFFFPHCSVLPCSLLSPVCFLSGRRDNIFVFLSIPLVLGTRGFFLFHDAKVRLLFSSSFLSLFCFLTLHSSPEGFGVFSCPQISCPFRRSCQNSCTPQLILRVHEILLVR